MVIVEVARGIPSNEYPLNGIFEWDQAKALKQFGHKVIYVAIDLRSIRRKRKFGLLKYELDGITVYNINIPLGRVPKFILDRIGWLTFKKVMKTILASNHVDMVHYHFGRTMCYVGLKAKEKLGLNYIVTEHESSMNSDDFDSLKENRLRKFYEQSKNNISVSIPFAKRLNKMFGVQFTYIPNIVDLSAISDCYNNPHNGYAFVSVGNLIERKGFDVLVKAFASVKKEKDNVKLIIIGEGPEKRNLIKLVKEKEIEKFVEFTGRLTRQEIKKKFENSDCFILTSRGETFGVVYIEGMAAGLPVIATRCGGPECFINDNNGILVDVDNVAKTAEAMINIMEKKFDRERLRQYCLDNFSPDVVAAKITELMEGK